MVLKAVQVFDKLNLRPIIPIWKRNKTGTNYSNLLRLGGAIPGILYGNKKPKINIAMPQNEIIRYFEKLPISLENTLFDLLIDNTKELAIPRDLCCNPVTEIPLSLNFMRHDPERGSHVFIPIRYYNIEKNDEIRQYGYVYSIHRYFECYAYGEYIPPEILCDVTNFKIGKHIKARDLDLPDNIEPVNRFYKVDLGVVKKNMVKFKKLNEAADGKTDTSKAPKAAKGQANKATATAATTKAAKKK